MKIDTTEISPFTGEKSVVIEESNGIETRICIETGFTTNSEYKVGSEKIEEFEKTTAELIRNLRYTDEELGQYWYPTTVMFTHGIIYPEGNLTDWQWVFAPVVKLTEEERKKYPVPGKDGEYYETRIAIDKAERYGHKDFKTVCKRVGLAKEVVSE
tara:strand:- start:1461 stop:1928 length:468 start_codon:yes stop_codon:yes gene_type:complete